MKSSASSKKMLNCAVVVILWLLCIFGVLPMASGQIPDSSQAVRLYYYPNTLNSSERHEVFISPDTSSFQNAKLDTNKPAKIIIHGVGGNCMKNDFPFRAIEAYLRKKHTGQEDYNIFCLDYGPLARPAGRISNGETNTSFRTRFEYVSDLVSEKAASFILALKQNGYIISLDQVHIIGHSLGGQISGFIGRKIQEKTNYQEKLGRITGLDAMNMFIIYNNEVRLRNQLDLSDANFVDIIHTSPIGLKGDFGHVDFYPDGGIHQRSCLMKGPVSNVTEMITGSCSHVIVGKYWENSIDNPNITACKADSWKAYNKKMRLGDCKLEDTIVFGEYVPKSARGKYFLEYPLINV